MLFFFRCFERLLHLKFHHGIFGQTLKPFFTDKPFFPGILTKEKIKDKTNNRKKHQHQYPSQSLEWITIIHDDNYNSSHDSQQKDKANHRRKNAIKESPCNHNPNFETNI